MIAHDEIAVGRDLGGGIVTDIGILRGHVRLGNFAAIDVDDTAANLDGFSGKGDDALDERFGAIERIPEDHYVSAVDGLETIDELIDEDTLLIGEERSHAGTFDFYGLIQEDDDDQRETDSDEEIAGPDTDFVPKELVRRRRSGR